MMYGIAVILESIFAMLKSLCGLNHRLLLTRDAVVGVCCSFKADGNKIQRVLGYEPIFTPQEAFDRTLQFILADTTLPDGNAEYDPSQYAGPTTKTRARSSGRPKGFAGFIISIAFMSLLLIGAAMPFKFCAKVPFQRIVDIAGEDGLEIVWNELRI